MELKPDCPAVNVSSLCRGVGMSTQNWYKGKTVRKRRQVNEELVVTLVLEQRRMHPRMGGKKLYFRLRGQLRREGVRIGRDRFFEVLRRHGLLVDPPPRSCRTTDSRHSLPMFPNLIRDMEITAPNQVWVSDITYVRTEDSFVYLALITDAYSRKIVGYHCGDSLEAIGCIRALDRALADLPEGACPIHHSDRGCQYCCHDYVNRLSNRGLGVSMTEIDHCAENALAERVNGILKQEYAISATFRSVEHARAAVEQAIWLYNNGRPHLSLKMEVPEKVHREAA